MKNHHKQQLLSIVLLIALAFLLNLLWELLHYQLYIDLSGISRYLHILLASFTDAIIILAIFIIVSLKNKNLNWLNKPSRLDYALIIILSLLIAIAIETWALNIGRWAYNNFMPTIFGIGLTPLIQLAVTSLVALWMVRKFKGRFHRGNRW